MALIVEVLGPRGAEVRQRIRLDRLPLTLGRQLDNDLVVDDPYVDAHHARFVQDEDGSIVLEDAGSLNKLWIPTHPKAERVRLAPGAELTVGRTRLRVRDAAAPIAAALPMHGAPAGAEDAAQQWYDRVPARAGAIIAAAGAVGLIAWLGSSERSAGTTVLGAALAYVVLALLWSGIWAIAGRAVVGQFRIAAHLAILSWMVLASLVLDLGTTWAEFLFPDNAVGDPIAGMVGLVMFAGLIAAHLAHASLQPRARRLRTGAIVAGVGLALVGAFSLLDDDEFTDVPEFSATIRSAPLGIIPMRSVDDFNTVMTDLRGTVDALHSETAP